MPRLARIVVPGMAHHVTQRGNRREAIFFRDGDHEVYRKLLAEQTRNADVVVWAYCLMPNHVHLILVPKRPDGLGIAVGEAHRRYTNFIPDSAQSACQRCCKYAWCCVVLSRGREANLDTALVAMSVAPAANGVPSIKFPNAGSILAGGSSSTCYESGPLS